VLDPMALSRATLVPAIGAGRARAVPTCWHCGLGTGMGPGRARHRHRRGRAMPFLYRAKPYRASASPTGQACMDNYKLCSQLILQVSYFVDCGLDCNHLMSRVYAICCDLHLCSHIYAHSTRKQICSSIPFYQTT
jgi:hypothetical protein